MKEDSVDHGLLGIQQPNPGSIWHSRSGESFICENRPKTSIVSIISRMRSWKYEKIPLSANFFRFHSRLWLKILTYRHWLLLLLYGSSVLNTVVSQIGRAVIILILSVNGDPDSRCRYGSKVWRNRRFSETDHWVLRGEIRRTTCCGCLRTGKGKSDRWPRGL